jgi:hypothetical protein
MAVGGLGMSAPVNGTPSFWRDRPVLVSASTGLMGAWLTRRLAEAGEGVVCLVRDWVPQSELVRSGTIEQVKVVRGDVTDRGLVEPAINEYKTGTVIDLATQTIVGPPTATRFPPSRATFVVLGNSIYERSATALPDFPIQHTLPARDGGSGDSQCPASTIISGRRRDPTSAEETLLSPKQCAEICVGPRRRNGPSRNPPQRVCYCDSTRHPCTVHAARRSYR